ncbi:tyrosine-type recombinase/integrase, partial [Acidiphilium sp.]|uniref:tyrosine-type recombinase/integrase n=1 Tax=Acidiphilium sp. TaxID=527 RepID=UPI003D023F2C
MSGDRTKADAADQGRSSLKIDQWPSQDHARWVRVKTRTGRFDRDAILQDLAAPTVRGLAQAMGRFLAYVSYRGLLPSEGSIGLALTGELVNDYVDHIRLRMRAGSVHEELRRLRTGFQILLPDNMPDWFNALPAAPSHAEVEASRKPIVRPDVASVLAAAYRVFDAIPTDRPDTVSCQLARNCLIVAFSALFELRLADLTRIRFGEHLTCAGGRWRLAFLDNVKNDSFLLFDMPPPLAVRLEHYLATFRVALLRQNDDHGFLWVGRCGTRILPAAIAIAIDKFGRSYLNRALNSHVFRHAFVVATMTRNPADAGLAAAGLGHTSEQMVQSCYSRSGSGELSKLWLKKLA